MLTISMVYRAGNLFLRIIRAAVLIYCIMTWFRPQNKFFYLLTKFVMPFILPFRKLSMWIMTRTRIPLDFSCYFALVGISVLQLIWTRICFALI